MVEAETWAEGAVGVVASVAAVVETGKGVLALAWVTEMGGSMVGESFVGAGAGSWHAHGQSW